MRGAHAKARRSARRWFSTGLATVVAACIFGSIATIALPWTASAATYDTAPISGLSNPWGIAFDAAGDLFVANNADNSITVLPASSGIIFGQQVTGGDAVTLTAATGLDSPSGLAFDAAGDLFIGNNDNNTITVLPASTGTIFGQSVTADVAVTLSAGTGFDGVWGLAFDAAGDLFVASEGNSSVFVIPKSSGAIFGQPVSADSPFLLLDYPHVYGPTSLAFDAAGDLFALSLANNTVTVDPASSGTIFGQPFVADTPATLAAATGLESPWAMTFDAAGDLFVANDAGTGSATVIPASTGTLFGQTVTANTAATFLPGLDGIYYSYGLAFDAAGDLYSSNQGNSTVTELLNPAPSTPQTLAFTSFDDDPTYASTYSPTVSVSPVSAGSPTPTFSIGSTSGAGVCAISGGVVTFTKVGTCVIDAAVAGTGSLEAGSTSQTVTVIPAPVSITASSALMPYGGTVPTVTPTVVGLVNGDALNKLGVITCLTTASPVSPVGIYPSGCSGASDPNYAITYYSGEVTVEATAPGPPTGVSATAGDGSITVTWTAPSSTGGAPISAYTVTALPQHGGTAISQTFDSTATTETLTGLTNAVPYDVAVAAFNSGYAIPGVPTQAADNPVTPESSVQTITFTSMPPTSPALASTYAPSATGGGSGDPVTFTVDPATTDSACSITDGIVTFTHAGTCVIDANQAAGGGFLAAPQVQQFVTVGRNTPTITWPSPPSITYGTALSSSELDATASVPGTFTYSPAAGTVLDAGSQSLEVGFAPSDGPDNASASASTTLTVTKATPTVLWSTPPPITYGTKLSADELDATASVPGTFTYTPTLGALEDAGSDSLSVSFTPSDTSDYQPVTTTVTLVVEQATPTITWAQPTAITAGTALSPDELDATASVPGTFVYKPGVGATPAAGTTTLTAAFTPTDAADYTSATDMTTLEVDAVASGSSLSTTTTTTTTTVAPSTTTTTTVVPSTTTTTTLAPSETTTTPAPAATTTPPSSPSASSIAENATTLPTPPSGTVNIEFAIQPGIALVAGKVHVHGHDFRPGSTVSIVAHSTPTLLGTATVKKDGTFSDVVGFPKGLPVGAHHIIVSGTLQNGAVVAQEEAFTVASGGLLGTVGSVPPGPLANDVAFVPAAHRSTVLATAAGGSVAIGAVASSLSGGFAAVSSGGTAGGMSGGGSGGGGGGGYLEDVELEREDAELRGGSRGDRSRSWRWPWTRATDHFSAHYPSRIAAISPVAGRVLVDGDYLRAMFGSLWLLMCFAAVGLGSYASASTGWYAVPPSLPIFIAILGVSIFDSTLGYLAGIAFFASALCAGHVTSALEVRTGAGIVLLWFAVPLAAAALRPLRRNLSLNIAGLWDRAADFVIGGLFAAWAAEKMTGALSGLAGVELPIAKNVDAIAFAVLAFVGLRIVVETIAAHHYPKRLEQVKHRGGLESENLQVGLSLIVQIVLFLFISVAFMGSTWGLYVGAAVFFSPLVPWLFADKIPKSKFVTKWKPTGLVNWAIIIVAGVLLSRLLDHLVHSDHLVEVLGFILLPLPVLISWALELFETEEEEGEEGEEDKEVGESPGHEGAFGDRDHGDLSLPVLAYAGAGHHGDTAANSFGNPPAHHGAEAHLEGESARSRFRAGQEERDEARDEHREAEAPWKAWLTRLAGVPLVVVSVYLVVTHIAGG